MRLCARLAPIRVNLGLSYHSVGSYTAACTIYSTALNSGLTGPTLRYNYAVSLSHLGSILPAVEQYRLAIQERLDVGEEYAEAWLNLAALHHKHGTLDDAIWHYDRTSLAILGVESYEKLPAAMHYGDEGFFRGVAEVGEVYELLLMVLNNVGQAMSARGTVDESLAYHGAARALPKSLSPRRACRPPNSDYRTTVALNLWR